MADAGDTDVQPLSADEQAMLADLLARKAAADAAAARAHALAQLDGVEAALGAMMSAAGEGALRAAAGRTWDQTTMQQLNRICSVLDIDGAALLATIAGLRGDPPPAAPAQPTT